MREQILSGLESWDRLRAAPAWRIGMTLFGLVMAGLLLELPLPAGLTEEGRRAAVVTGFMAVSWLGGVLPMAVTALIPVVAFPLLGVMSIQEATAPYADPLIFLMLGGFVLAHAMEEVGLHKRILAFLLGPQRVRENPRLTVLALMSTACVVSSFVSNTATMLMMLPLGLAVVGRLQGAVEEQSRARVRSASLLGLAYACSIGGVSTLVGTAPNAVFARMASSMAGHEIGFGAWMMVGVPFVLLALPTAWWLVTAVALPLPATVKEPLERPEKPPWAPGEPAVLVVLLLCFVAWLTRSPLHLDMGSWAGWGSWMPKKVDDSWVAISATLLLFLLPRPKGLAAVVEQDHGDDASEARFLLSWRRLNRKMPWSVLLLLGGGFAMAEAIEVTKLTDWLGNHTADIAGLPGPLAVLLICVGVSFMSAFTSNTATTQVALPLLAAAAKAAGVDPLLWMVPGTIAASCDFTMAVGTPPNAIAAEAGGVSAGDMFFAGIFLNVACALLATGVVLVMVPWIW